MPNTTTDNPVYTLDGLPISLLGLSKIMTERLAVLGIETVEQLARITLLHPPLVRIELTEAIQQEIRTRLWLENIHCSTVYSQDNDRCSQFIIESYLFHFVASITLDTHHCTCTYQWVDARLIGNVPFHTPKLQKPSRRKGRPASVSELQQPSSLFGEAEQEAQHQGATPARSSGTDEDTQATQSTMYDLIDGADATAPAMPPVYPKQAEEDIVTPPTPVQSETAEASVEQDEGDQSADQYDTPTDDMTTSISSADDESSTDELPDIAAELTAEMGEATPALEQDAETAGEPANVSAIDDVPLASPDTDEDDSAPLSVEDEELEQGVLLSDDEPSEDPVSLDMPGDTQHTHTDQRAQAIAQWDAYDHWNHTLIRFAVAGKRQGKLIFLSIDDDSIRWLTGQPSAGDGSKLADFYLAVKRRVVYGKSVKLSSLYGHNLFGEPKGVAFLAAMVIAASRMAAEEDEEEDQDVASNDYFTRLRDVLGMQSQGGRPRGMEYGAEQALWDSWSEWLVWQGYQSSVSSSGEKATKYISYPISQALLRGADKDRLHRLFAEKRWPEDLDAETLMTYVQREAPYLTKHLQKLLASKAERLQAATEAIHDVYEDWDGSEDTGRTHVEQAGSRHIMAGLIRSENVFTGEVSYRIYPRISAKRQADRLQVKSATASHTLLVERPGRYLPFYQLNEHDLSQGVQFAIEQSPGLEKLILPARSFWVLSPDPDDPDSGAFASWGHPPLGTPFILLCRQSLLHQLERLRDERLIQWQGEPRDIFGAGEWLEIDQCQVISQAWDGVEIENQELYITLRPREDLNISLSDGLRAPDGSGWMETRGPEITVFGFQSAVNVTISRQNDGYCLLEQEQQTNQPFTFDWPGVGHYLIEAAGINDTRSRLVQIISWDDIRRTSVPQPERVAINGWRICGALIEEQE